MRVLVTRPEPEADRWAADLAARGIDAVALPLIAIGPAPDAAALQQAHDALPRQDAAMFVSTNAVRHFFAARSASPWPAGPRAWAPGGATAAELRRAGVPPERIVTPAAGAAQWDSEHLWPQVAPHVGPGFRLLVVRGADRRGRPAGRDWLSDQVHAAGGTVDWVSAYTRRPPAWNEAQRTLATAARGPDDAWLFSSSEALRHLAELLPHAAWGRATALATHPRIAETAAAAGFGRVVTSGPGLEAVVASIESLR